MAKKKFLDDVKLNPARFYRLPSDVNRDRRLSDDERLEILLAWEEDARTLALVAEDVMPGHEPSRLEQIVQARMDAQKRVPTNTDVSPAVGVTAGEPEDGHHT